MGSGVAAVCRDCAVKGGDALTMRAACGHHIPELCAWLSVESCRVKATHV